jgi:class 3 adenylate cyclase/pimeloyl-ACP methyl ester carboxylesterase
MEPMIQYATTSDDVTIAYWAVGDGPPLVIMPTLPVSNLQIEWEIPPFRAYIEWFARTHRVIRYDARGTGLSDRRPPSRSLDSHLLDVEAVMARQGFIQFDVFAASYSGPVAIRYAARHPEAVTRLVLWCTHAAHREVTARLPQTVNEQREAVNRLAAVDFELFIRTYLHRAIGWTEGELANQFAELARNSIEPAEFFQALVQYSAFDAVDDLPAITCPTLVLHRPAFVGSSVEVGKGLAARIRGARLVLLGGESVVPFIGDVDEVLATTEDFLGSAKVLARPPAPYPLPKRQPAGAVRALLYTDVEGHSEMMQRLGDARGRELLRAHESLTRESLRKFHGEEVKTLGDGFLASFSSAQAALECAAELQRAFEAQPPVHGETLRVRVGVNAGEPIVEDDDLFGSAVIATSRIAGHAHGGQVLLARVVRELVAGKGFQFDDRGELDLDGGREATHLYELRWRERVRQ